MKIKTILILVCVLVLFTSIILLLPKNVGASQEQVKVIRVGNLFFTDGFGVYSYDPITKRFTKISKLKGEW